jgi:site-specific DNA-cytosine methylase
MARTLKATTHDSGVIEIYSEPKCKVAGNLTGGVWDKMHEQSKRVYDPEGISPTVHTCGGGNLEPKVVIKQATSQGYAECEIGGVADLSYPESKTRRGRVQEGGTICPTITAESNGLCRIEPCIAAMRGRNPGNPTSRESGIPTQQMLEVKDDGTSNTLTTVQKDNLVIEPQVLTPKRTEHGKAVRKSYESGAHQESRHTMTELEPRIDGISNTLTTVQKDNLVIEPKLIGGIGEVNFGTQFRQGNRVYDSDAIAMALMAGPVGNAGGNSYLYKVEEPQYRVRKLTPKECWRLMGFTDEDFCKAEKVNSNTQLYKQAGNSIVVNVLEEIFKQMF